MSIILYDYFISKFLHQCHRHTFLYIYCPWRIKSQKSHFTLSLNLLFSFYENRECNIQKFFSQRLSSYLYVLSISLSELDAVKVYHHTTLRFYPQEAAMSRMVFHCFVSLALRGHCGERVQMLNEGSFCHTIFLPNLIVGPSATLCVYLPKQPIFQLYVSWLSASNQLCVWSVFTCVTDLPSSLLFPLVHSCHPWHLQNVSLKLKYLTHTDASSPQFVPPQVNSVTHNKPVPLSLKAVPSLNSSLLSLKGRHERERLINLVPIKCCPHISDVWL